MSVGSIQKVADVFNPAGFANFAWGATAYQDYVPGDVEHFKACKVSISPHTYKIIACRSKLRVAIGY